MLVSSSMDIVGASLKPGATETEIPTLADEVGPSWGSAAAGVAKVKNSKNAAAPGHAPLNQVDAPRLPLEVNAPERPGLLRLAVSCVIPLAISHRSQALVALSSAMDVLRMPRKTGRNAGLLWKNLCNLTQN